MIVVVGLLIMVGLFVFLLGVASLAGQHAQRKKR